MAYYFNTVIEKSSFDKVLEKLTEDLKSEGFGILTEIDVQATFKKKLDIDFKKYKILGACNPQFAYKAIKAEDKIGVFLPCNIVVEENNEGNIEVSAVDPIASMVSVENEELGSLAREVQERLKNVILNLKAVVSG